MDTPLLTPVRRRRARGRRRLGGADGRGGGRRRCRPGGVARAAGTRAALGLGHQAGDGVRGPGGGAARGAGARRAGRAARLDGPPPAGARGWVRLRRRRPAAPGRTRIYSNAGFDTLGEVLEAAARRPFAELLAAWVLEPLAMSGTRLEGRPSEGLVGPAADLAALAHELLAPVILPAGLIAEAATVAFPGLRGVLPGFGLQDPTTGGWASRSAAGSRRTGRAARNSPATFGHFGRSGTFLWADPVAGLALACLTDRPFGAWAGEAWPALSDAVLAAAADAAPIPRPGGTGPLPHPRSPSRPDGLPGVQPRSRRAGGRHGRPGRREAQRRPRTPRGVPLAGDPGTRAPGTDQSLPLAGPVAPTEEFGGQIRRADVVARGGRLQRVLARRAVGDDPVSARDGPSRGGRI